MPRIGPLSSQCREGSDQVLMEPLDGVAFGIVRRGLSLHDSEDLAHLVAGGS